MRYAVGHGYDVHRLVEHRPLILGGVTVEHTLGLLGHSDADVLLHAIMDALLGAVGEGDIGRHFPDSGEEFRGISSLELLRRTAQLLSARGAVVSNIDATLIAQQPRLVPYIPLMVANIATTLSCDSTRINIKATTEEHLGFTGRCEGIAAHAVAMVECP